jgi:hypothetical protein
MRAFVVTEFCFCHPSPNSHCPVLPILPKLSGATPCSRMYPLRSVSWVQRGAAFSDIEYENSTMKFQT